MRGATRALFSAWARAAARVVLWRGRGRILTAYARGSYGTGGFRPFASDLDLVCVWRPLPEEAAHAGLARVNAALRLGRRVNPFIRDAWQLVVAEADLPLCRAYWASLGEAPAWLHLAGVAQSGDWRLPRAASAFLASGLMQSRAFRLHAAWGAKTTMHAEKGRFFAATLDEIVSYPETSIAAATYGALMDRARRQRAGASLSADLRQFDRLVGRVLERFPAETIAPRVPLGAPADGADAAAARELLRRRLPPGSVIGATFAGDLHVVLADEALADERTFAVLSRMGQELGCRVVPQTQRTYGAYTFRALRRYVCWKDEAALAALSAPAWHARAQSLHITLMTLLEYHVVTQYRDAATKLRASLRVLARGAALVEHDALCPTAASAFALLGWEEPPEGASEAALFARNRALADWLRPRILAYSTRHWRCEG